MCYNRPVNTHTNEIVFNNIYENDQIVRFPVIARRAIMKSNSISAIRSPTWQSPPNFTRNQSDHQILVSMYIDSYLLTEEADNGYQENRLVQVFITDTMKCAWYRFHDQIAGWRVSFLHRRFRSPTAISMPWCMYSTD